MKCPLPLAFLIMFLIEAEASRAQDASFSYENFYITSTGAAEIVLKFNNPSSSILKFVRAECALLDKDGRVLTVVTVIGTNILPLSYGYAKNYGPTDLPVQKADCRITTTDFKSPS